MNAMSERWELHARMRSGRKSQVPCTQHQSSTKPSMRGHIRGAKAPLSSGSGVLKRCSSTRCCRPCNPAGPGNGVKGRVGGGRRLDCDFYACWTQMQQVIHDGVDCAHRRAGDTPQHPAKSAVLSYGGHIRGEAQTKSEIETPRGWECRREGCHNA